MGLPKGSDYRTMDPAMMFLKMMVLPMLIKVLSKTGRPFLCSTFYVLIIITNGLIFDLALGASWGSVALQVAIAAVLSSLYFWLLHEFEGADAIYWTVFALGFLAIIMI